MNPRHISAIIIRQFYLLRHSPTRLFQIVSWSSIEVILWGFITKYLGSVIGRGFSVVAVFLGAVVLWEFLGRAMQGVTVAFFEDVWSQNFLNMFASPLKVSEYITGLVLSSIVTTTLGMLFIVILAGLFFGLSLAALGFLLVPFLLTLFLFGITLGIFGASVVLRFGPSAEWLVWPIPALVSPFVGVFYPLSTLPLWMQRVSAVLPPSYVFEGMRAVLAGNAFDATSLSVGLLLAVFFVFLSSLFFLRVYRTALRTGRIARYSAESWGI